MENQKLICKVCGSLRYQSKYRDVGDSNFSMTDRLYNWNSCLDCDTLQISTNDLKEEDLAEYYKVYDPHTHKVRIVNKWSNSPINKVINHIKSLKDIDDSFSILDIGCGDGSLLYNLRDTFPNSVLYGIDFNTSSSNKNLANSNVRLYQGDLTDIAFDMKFDFVCNSQLLEHLDNPSDLFNLIKVCLKKDGLGFLDTPNADSRSFKLFGSNWVHLDTPRHRVLYTPNSLNIILEKNNFQKIEIKCFGTGFAYLSSFLLLLKKKLQLRSKPPFKFQWMIAKIIELFIKSEDKIFLVFKHK